MTVTIIIPLIPKSMFIFAHFHCLTSVEFSGPSWVHNAPQDISILECGDL